MRQQRRVDVDHSPFPDVWRRCLDRQKLLTSFALRAAAAESRGCSALCTSRAAVHRRDDAGDTALLEGANRMNSPLSGSRLNLRR